jgi:hypothetical protein
VLRVAVASNEDVLSRLDFQVSADLSGVHDQRDNDKPKSSVREILEGQLWRGYSAKVVPPLHQPLAVSRGRP